MDDIFRASREEYGGFEVYCDTDGDFPEHGDYFFLSRQKYFDSRDHYVRGAWGIVGEHVPPTP
jgi:hypothetical protein